MAYNCAQLVIGPPGSGKSTYCLGMKEFLTALGRKVAVVNLDPANSILPYECAIDISELISLSEVMDGLKLGPNGSLVYCMEFLEKNLEWLEKQMDKWRGHYFLFDCPGQVELFTHHQSVRNIAARLQKWNFKVQCIVLTFGNVFCQLLPSISFAWGLQLVAVHLVDSHYCSDPGKFISVLLTSLSTMVQLELPHINVLSKVDLMEQYGKLG